MAANLTESEWQLIIDQINLQESLHLSLAEPEETIVYEIVVYALLINEENRDYAFLEITVYTKEPVSPATVFECIETQGFRAQRREEGLNRVDVNQLKIGRMPRELPAGQELTDDWCGKILDQIVSIHWEHPKSGYYYRKKAGISSAEYKKQRKEKMEARTRNVQERLDTFGLE